MSIICPAGCGKKFVNEYHIKRHLEVMHKGEAMQELKRKGWATPYGFVDFKEPVTYEEACELSKVLGEAMRATLNEKKAALRTQGEGVK